MQPTDAPSPADPQARFPESELVQAINRLRSVYLPGATPRHLSASECRSIRQHIREAIEAHDALRERCLAAEMRVAPLSLADAICEAIAVRIGAQCTCVEWAPQVERINGPIVLQQIRGGQPLPPDYFVAWRYCPWCGAALAPAKEPAAEQAEGVTPTETTDA